MLQADPSLLSSAINNILVNAIKYSRVNDELNVHIKKTNNHYVIDIIDYRNRRS